MSSCKPHDVIFTNVHTQICFLEFVIEKLTKWFWKFLIVQQLMFFILNMSAWESILTADTGITVPISNLVPSSLISTISAPVLQGDLYLKYFYCFNFSPSQWFLLLLCSPLDILAIEDTSPQRTFAFTVFNRKTDQIVPKFLYPEQKWVRVQMIVLPKITVKIQELVFSMISWQLLFLLVATSVHLIGK